MTLKRSLLALSMGVAALGLPALAASTKFSDFTPLTSSAI